MFCVKCGRNIDDEKVCPYCGAENGQSANDMQDGQYHVFENSYNVVYDTYDGAMQKSRVVAGLLQIFLGCIGIGRFYMGYIGIGIAQIIASICSFGLVGAVWGFVDGVMILNGKPDRDANGIPMKN
ncbi:MAG: TM2 domain-containing protein [Clostridia bacterium]|nr:TM2 domain-containing protein [Clostridia bacterium]